MKRSRETEIISYQKLVERIPNAAVIFLSDSDMTIIHSNQLMWNLADCQTEEEFMRFCDGSYRRLIAKSDRNNKTYLINQPEYLEENSQYRERYHIVTKEQEEKLIEDIGGVLDVFDEGAAVFNVLTEIASDHALRDSDQPNSMDSTLWKGLMESKTINLFWKDKNRRFVGANQRFLDVFGLPDVSAIRGKTDEDMKWNIDPDTFKMEEQKVLNEGVTLSNVLAQCIIKNNVHNILTTKEPLYQDGRIVGLFDYFVFFEN